MPGQCKRMSLGDGLVHNPIDQPVEQALALAPHPLQIALQRIDRAEMADRPARRQEDGLPDHEWTGGALPTFVSHLECSLTGERCEADRLHGLSRAGRPLLVRYDLDGVRRALPRTALAERPQTLWRYRELLPVTRPENVLALGEVVTPLISLPRLAGRLSQGGELLVKDEGRLP